MPGLGQQLFVGKVREARARAADQEAELIAVRFCFTGRPLRRRCLHASTLHLEFASLWLPRSGTSDDTNDFRAS